MIELSGYTGKSANSVRDRLLASREMKSNKSNKGVQRKKYTVKYSHQTHITTAGLNPVQGGAGTSTHVEVEVNSVPDFEKFLISTVIGKHKNPEKFHRGNRHTIMSKLDNNLRHVDIIEIEQVD